MTKAEKIKKFNRLIDYKINESLELCREIGIDTVYAIFLALSEKKIESIHKSYFASSQNKFSKLMFFEHGKTQKIKRKNTLLSKVQKPINFDNCTRLMNRTENVEIQNKILEHFIGMTLKIESYWMECPNYLKPYIGA